MPRGNYIIQRSCEECGKIFTPPTLVSKYCCPACSKRAYKKRQVAKEKEAIRQALIRRMSFEPKDCYTIGEIAKKFHINDSSVFKHIRRHSIPTRQIGNYVYVPKSEIDKLYKSL